MSYTIVSILSKLEAIMKHLLLGLFILTMPVSTALAEEQTTDNTTETLENSEITEPLTNEALPTDQENTTKEEKQTKTRSKWDFSDHPEDKKSKAGNTPEKTENKNPVKPKDKWKMDKATKQTWKFPTSSTTKSSGY
jgi:hypothetical protein